MYIIRDDIDRRSSRNACVPHYVPGDIRFPPIYLCKDTITFFVCGTAVKQKSWITKKQFLYRMG